MSPGDLARIEARLDADDAPAWGVDYRKCPVCGAEIGAVCRALNGRVAGGRPDGVATPLNQPHAARKRRARR